MTEHYNMFVVGWLFLLLIGGWVLVNALIDLGARRVRQWISERMTTDNSTLPGRVQIEHRETR